MHARLFAVLKGYKYFQEQLIILPTLYHIVRSPIYDSKQYNIINFLVFRENIICIYVYHIQCILNQSFVPKILENNDILNVSTY